MKKFFSLFVVIFLAALMVSCQSDKNNAGENNSSSGNNNQNENGEKNNSDKNSDQNEENPKTPLLKIKDYFPTNNNTRYVYEGIGNEYASYDVYNDYINGDKVQQRVNNGGTVMANVIQIKDGRLTKVLSRGEAYYRENLLTQSADNGEVLLMEPLQKGTKWTVEDSKVRAITNTSFNVSTPAGNYQTIEVTTEGPNDKTIDYYAKNVGLVKSVFISGDSEITSTLSKIEENVPLIQTITFYYPNIEDGKIYYKNKEISFNTNEITRKVLEEAYKEQANNQIGTVFSPNTKINSLYINNDQHVYIDLNQEFINEMSAGAGYEGMILQALANTFGHYYNAERVYLTINNKLYESGHFSMQKGEYLKVKTEDTIEIK